MVIKDEMRQNKNRRVYRPVFFMRGYHRVRQVRGNGELIIIFSLQELCQFVRYSEYFYNHTT